METLEWTGGIDACWNYWMCVPTTDRAGVLSALGLELLRRSSFDEAGEIINALAHEHDETISLVFVTPPIDGWTAVIGPWCDAFNARRAPDARALVERLSVAFGEAHAFYFGSQNDGNGWMIARDGETVRLCADQSAVTPIGESLPIELEWLTRLGLEPPVADLDDDDNFEFFYECSALAVARAISVDTVWGLPATAPRGDGVLAARSDDETARRWSTPDD
ncbi:hypothetical protein KOI35_16100 [Actinoplanes bogorensis]|uniref:Uncharacterized protein n=1 Tax=Paractinoplanes bogorensis TaxID=1610840 RepID=A0ABS5YNI7_9ACTN|nr:hypothetical protein [Actinoplanes bogorensis]MBU2665027.1 hypothetical protein [Actinoplanes bogorensis]